MSSTPQPQPQAVKSEEPPMNSLTPTPSTPATPQPAAPASYTWAIDPALQAQSATPAQNASTSNAGTPKATTPAPTPGVGAYQYGQPGTGTYQYGYYPGYYSYHPTTGTSTPTTAATPAAATTSTANTATAATAAGATAGTTANASASANQVDSSDIATLNDALGSAGVDLRAEEESLQTSSFRTASSYLSTQHGDRTRKQPPTPAFNTTFLSATMKTIGAQHKITRIPDESVNYLALALRARLGDLITSMIKAAEHRTSGQFDRPATFYPAPNIDPSKGGVSEAMVTDPIPMWSILIRSDVAKQLAAIEKVEREEEMRVRRERKERAELAASHAAALAAASSGNASAANGDGDEDGAPKKKRKKEGPGVTARNMSEDVRKKMSNAVASQAAGLGGRYAWMTAANANAPPPPKKPQPAASTSTSTTTTNTAATSTGTSSTPTSSWGKPYTATQAAKTDEDSRMGITMRDAMFVVSTERGHGGGRGAARGWT
ncbi:hypothetical protein Moror_17249 [Moniliophthora roreri MCA 2997]|uniref:Transcription initiation factor TFIID subunit 4 n=1 Tax=Moniliophthora roreri (strain MCA 2997) TaxID=1381753 RepID=V2XZ68_MONRO|nr:hypothetical protein Moror_17249 [Moniliophthora roreri MCA 2997]